MKLRYTRLALNDLEAVFRFISDDDPAAADIVLGRIDRAIQGLVQWPERGRRGRVAGTRELIVGQTSYIVAYEIKGDTIYILAIMHGRRAWPSSF